MPPAIPTNTNHKKWIESAGLPKSEREKIELESQKVD